MSAEKDSAIILRVVPFSETSCIVTLFTREFGKIGALAKGARRPKGPFEAALDLLALVRIVFLHKSSQGLDLLTEAKLQRRFRAGGRELSRLYAAFYVIELLDALTTDADPHPELFDAAVRALERLDEQGEVAREVLRFELSAMRFLGHLPALDRCVECGGSVGGELPRMAFGLIEGGVLCVRCKVGKRQLISFSRPAVALMRQLAGECERGWQLAELDRKVFAELRGIVSRYICHLLGRKPRMHQYMDWFGQIRGNAGCMSSET
ncbi:MAG: DNA repair protein RecO [Pirellulaceae bacterium]